MDDNETRRETEGDKWMAFLRAVAGTAKEMQEDFDGILADKEAVEQSFGEVLHYESQGGYGE